MHAVVTVIVDAAEAVPAVVVADVDVVAVADVDADEVEVVDVAEAEIVVEIITADVAMDALMTVIMAMMNHGM